MAGSLHDRATPGLTLPSLLVLDSSIVIHWMAAVGWSAESTPASPVQIGAARLIGQIVRARGTGVVTPTSLIEVFHFEDVSIPSRGVNR